MHLHNTLNYISNNKVFSDKIRYLFPLASFIYSFFILKRHFFWVAFRGFLTRRMSSNTRIPDCHDLYFYFNRELNLEVEMIVSTEYASNGNCVMETLLWRIPRESVILGISLVVQWLSLCAHTAEGAGFKPWSQNQILPAATEDFPRGNKDPACHN